MRPGWPLTRLLLRVASRGKPSGGLFKPQNARGIFNPRSQGFVLHRDFTHHTADAELFLDQFELWKSSKQDYRAIRTELEKSK
jgi:hypothetical protein